MEFQAGVQEELVQLGSAVAATTTAATSGESKSLLSALAKVFTPTTSCVPGGADGGTDSEAGSCSVRRCMMARVLGKHIAHSLPCRHG